MSGSVVRASLRGARGARDVALALAHALELTEVADADARAMAGALRRGSIAFVLFTDCESLDDAGRAAIDELLRVEPALRVVATSRVPLGSSFETVVEIGPLAIEDRPEEPSPSRQLFLARARQADALLDVDALDPASLSRVIRALEGVPLAIELAAPWLTIMTLDWLAERLERSRANVLRPVAGGPVSRSMQDVFDEGFRLLSDAERDGLISLATFSGTFDAQAAEAVIGGDRAVDVLFALRRNSWVHRPGARAGDMAIFETVRELVARVGDAADVERAVARHAAYYERLVQELAARTDQGALQAQRRSAEEVATAAMRLVASPRLAELTRAIALAWGLWEIADQRLAPSGLHHILTRATAHVSLEALDSVSRARLGILLDQAGLRPLDHRALRAHIEALGSGVPPLRLASLLRAASSKAYASGDFEACAELRRMAREATASAGPMFAAAARVHTVAAPGDDQERPEHALREARRAVDELRRLSPPPRVLMHPLLTLAIVELDQGDPACAWTVLTEVRALARTHGYLLLEKYASSMLAIQAVIVGDIDAATQYERERESLGDPDPNAYWVPMLRAAHFLAIRDVPSAMEELARVRRLGPSPASDICAALEVRIAIERGTAISPYVFPQSTARSTQASFALESALQTAMLEVARHGAVSSGTRTAVGAALRDAEELAPRSFVLRGYLRTAAPALASLSLETGQTRLPWTVSPDASVAMSPDGARIDLRNQPVLASVLNALLDAHARRPGVALDVDDLVKRAWPGERMLARAAKERVKASIARLRRLGLGGLVEHAGSGYRVPREVLVLRRTDKAP